MLAIIYKILYKILYNCIRSYYNRRTVTIKISYILHCHIAQPYHPVTLSSSVFFCLFVFINYTN